MKVVKDQLALVVLLVLVVCLVVIILNPSYSDIYSDMNAMRTEALERGLITETNLDFNRLILNSSDLRTSEDKILAIEKFIAGNGKMVMFHYASCCESTLSKWFHSIENKLNSIHSNWNSSIQHIEITHNFHESFGSSIEDFVRSNRDTVFVICFSSPMKRILAQYDKEWRWGCMQADGCGTKTRMEEYNKSLLSMDNYMNIEQHDDNEDRFGAIDFNDFIYRIMKFEIEQQPSVNHKLYQMFINNYYLWSFCCSEEKCNIARDIASDGHKLKRCIISMLNVLQSFDLIFVKDWIRDLRVQHFVNELFFTDNNVDDQQHKFVAVEKKSYTVSKIGINYMYDPDEEYMLNVLNAYDVKLYDWIKDLVFNRTHIVWERAKFNKNNRNELIYDLGYKDIILRSDPSFTSMNKTM